MADILVAIRPQFVARILAGQKTVELRRGHTRIRRGDRLLLYSSSPERRIVARCIVGGVLSGKPASVRRSVVARAGVSTTEFNAYAAGASSMSAIELVGVEELARPIDLVDLRRLRPGFVVPQSYRYLSPSESSALGVSHGRRAAKSRIVA